MSNKSESNVQNVETIETITPTATASVEAPAVAASTMGDPKDPASLIASPLVGFPDMDKVQWSFAKPIAVSLFKGIYDETEKRYLDLSDYIRAIESELKELRAEKNSLIGEDKVLFNPLKAWAASLEEGNNDSMAEVNNAHDLTKKLRFAEFSTAGSNAPSMGILLMELAQGRSDSKKQSKRLGISEKQARKFHKAITEVSGFANERQKGFFSSSILTADIDGQMEQVVKHLDEAATLAMKRNFDGALSELTAAQELTGLSLGHLAQISQVAIIAREIGELQSKLMKSKTDWADIGVTTVSKATQLTQSAITSTQPTAV